MTALQLLESQHAALARTLLSDLKVLAGMVERARKNVEEGGMLNSCGEIQGVAMLVECGVGAVGALRDAISTMKRAGIE